MQESASPGIAVLERALHWAQWLCALAESPEADYRRLWYLDAHMESWEATERRYGRLWAARREEVLLWERKRDACRRVVDLCTNMRQLAV